jgi:hypothetical protein
METDMSHKDNDTEVAQQGFGGFIANPFWLTPDEARAMLAKAAGESTSRQDADQPSCQKA